MNIDERYRSLERHFETIDRIILSRQDPVTGLLPASTAVNAHGDYTDAWVRDNVYSILGVWGLYLAYRRYNPDHHRGYLLGQSVVKLMRGLLGAMMRQSERVEAFKHTLDPTDALHAKYGTHTGLAVVGDTEWGHLQLDATSLFLLMVAQMTASGLRLIYTIDEVNFIQNLVHYVSRSYCTPDYGIWERGNKINHGTTEINCSSVGMAKAALEAMDGFNLFGNVVSQEAVVHVVSNDIARTRFTLHSLLPRESTSKETDAALLSIIGYPGYAVEDAQIVQRTRGKIIKKLAGRYGCKRFLLDGHQSVLEDPNRLHYEPSELRRFENIESEWPLFFTYLLLDALMRGDAEAAARWREKLEPLFIEQDGQRLLPELYIVPAERIDAEKAAPGSQERIANENLPLVWAQSLFMLSDMIHDGLLRPADIDPLRRRERIGLGRTTHPMVAVLAENDAVKQQLLDLGIDSETLNEVKPVTLMHAWELSRVHTLLGKNEKLGLSGRPLLVIRTMTTSRLYLLAGEETVFLPYYFNPRGFYFSYDNKLLTAHFRSSLRFLATHWNQPGQPIVPFLVREDMLSDREHNVVIELLHALQTSTVGSVVIKTGPLGQLLSTAAVERIDNLHGFVPEELRPHTEAECIASLEYPKEQHTPLGPAELERLETSDDTSLIQALISNPNRRVMARALELLWQRHGAAMPITAGEQEVTLDCIAEQHYSEATFDHDWAVVRRIAEITGKFDDRLEDALLDIVIRQKRLAVGRAYSEKATFSKPMESAAILRIIDEFCGSNAAERVLTQEIILHLGHLIRNESGLFNHMLTLRSWYFVQLLVGQVSREEGLPMGDAYEFLLGLAPHDIYDRLRAILQSFSLEVTKMSHQENLQVSGVANPETIKTAPQASTPAEVDDWMQWRRNAGLIGRFPPKFYKHVWYMLQQCRGLVIGDKYNVQNRMGSEQTLDATAGERSFELRVDTLFQNIHTPEYRQLNIEAIESLAEVFRQNPDLRIESDLILDVLIGHAVRLAWEAEHDHQQYDEQRGQAWEAFYALSPQQTETAFVEALKYLVGAEGL